MIRSYSGNTRPFALVLCADDAAEKSEQLMRLISEKGTSLCVENGGRPCKDKAKRAYAVIALLTKGFADSKNLQDALFEADSAGKAIIPIHLDDHPQSEEVNRILFARNALFAENYSGPEELAQRVYAGSVLEHPFITEAQKKARRKTLGAIIAAAAAVAIAAGLTISGMIKNRPDSADIKPDVPDVFDELTSEQLQKITNVVMLGDSFFYSTYEEPPIGDRFSYAHDGPEEDGETYSYFSHEDGSRIENKHYDDLSFLAQLPNLKNLQLVCIDSPAFPDLTGCMALKEVSVCNCTMTDLSAIAGTNITSFESSRTPIESFAPLTDCKNLNNVQIDLYQQNSSFEGFGPANLY